MPWALTRLDPTRVWPLATGGGQLVAVVATGVDARNPQFGPGQVLTGTEVIDRSPGGRADSDCDGRGTVAAGIIAARPDRLTAVVGLAPGARILPVRVTQAVDRGDPPGGPDSIAAGIRFAVAQGADVVCVTVATRRDSARLRAAVRAALVSGAVVVSAGDAGTRDEAGPTYPTSSPGVIGVVGVDREDGLVDGSEVGAGVDVAAPGADLWSTGAGGRAGLLAHTSVGTAPAMSAAYVAGVVALVRSAHPRLDPAQVAHRIAVTADRTTASGTGAGVVNPYAAVAAVLPEEEDRIGGSRRPQVPPPVARTPPGADLRTRRLAVGTAAAGAVTVLAVLGAGATVQVGRRRRWRPQRRSPAPASGQGPGTGPGEPDGRELNASGRHARRT